MKPVAIDDPNLKNARRRLRQLRWFRHLFHKTAARTEPDLGAVFAVDDVRLARAFFAWIEALEAARPTAGLARADFVVFAAGTALRELFRHRPASAFAAAGDWPEGRLYTQFCLAGITVVEQQEFGRARTFDACLEDARFWASYRENVTATPSLALPFLDRICAETPNWLAPDSPRDRPAVMAAIGRAGLRASLAG